MVLQQIKTKPISLSVNNLSLMTNTNVFLHIYWLIFFPHGCLISYTVNSHSFLTVNNRLKIKHLNVHNQKN